MVKVSVIVPVFNSEKFLHRCVDSILNQSFQDFELLLVDDGSTDDSSVICDEYAVMDNRVRVFHKENGGVSSARNVGLDYARGEWVTFCDSDDFVSPYWLENYDLFRDIDVDLIQQGAIADKPIFRGECKSNYGKELLLDSSSFLDYIYHYNILGYLWVKAFRRDIIVRERLYFEESLALKEDELFLIEYIPYSRLCRVVPKNGYYYSVPDFFTKYGVDDSASYLERILSVLGSSAFNQRMDVIRSFKDDYICLLIRKFPSCPRLRFLRTIRNYHLEDFDATRLNNFIKKILIIDSTFIFSWFLFYSYSFIRRFKYCIK